MRKLLISMFENGTLHLLLLALTLAAVFLLSGCSVTKINYERDKDGVVSYRIYRNDHWLKTSASGISGGMTDDGKFEFSAEGMESSPSEEFNKTMKTYTAAVVSMMQLAAAAYNPSSSGVAAAKAAEPAQTVVNVQPAAAATTNAAVSSSAAPSAKEETSGSEAK